MIGSQRDQGSAVVWYQRRANGWNRLLIDDTVLDIEAGGAFHDIDGDGDLDIAMGSDSRSNQVWWWENPYPNFSPNQRWTRRLIKNSGAPKHHDEMFGDFDGDGRAEFVYWNQHASGLFLADILRFVPTSLGKTTAGSFSLYFDGSDVELTTSGEDIDAFDLLPDGRLLISVLGAAQAGTVKANDEDLLFFTPSTLGDNTAGSWALAFDGSTLGLSTGQEDIWGVKWATNGQLYLSLMGAFSAGTVSGDGADIVRCTAGSLGDQTSCTLSLFWDSSAFGFGAEIIDAFDLVDAAQVQNTSFATVTEDEADIVEENDDEFNGDEEDFTVEEPLLVEDSTMGADERVESEIQIFLPLVNN